MDDLRPGKSQFSVSLLPGARLSALDCKSLAAQLRAAYQGVKVDDVYQQRDGYEINVKLAQERPTALAELEQLTVFSRYGVGMPLAAIATLEERRELARAIRVDCQCTVTISLSPGGDRRLSAVHLSVSQLP